MKVLFISNDKAIFDAGSSVRTRMKSYADAIGTLHIVGRARHRVEETDGSLLLHGYPLPAFLALCMFEGIVRRLVRKEQIEVVSVQDPFEYGWIGMRAVTGTGAKLHVQLHTDVYSPWFFRGSFATACINRIRLFLAETVLPRADRIRVVSRRIEATLRNRFGDRLPPVSLLPIPPSVVVPPRKELPKHPFSFVFMAVSRLEEEKRIPDLFHALFKVQRRYPHAGLIVVGDGRLRTKLMQQAHVCCKPGSIMFLPWQDDVLALLQSAHAFVQASAYEGYGRTFVEAALAHVPIVSTDVGIMGEVFEHQKEALLCAPGDIATLARNMETIIEDERMRVMLPMAAKQKVESHLALYADQPRLIAEDLAQAIKKA